MSESGNGNGWAPEIEELRRREELTARMGGDENIAKHHDRGRLTVRERIDGLLDEGSFHEIGAVTGAATYDGDRLVDLRPSNFIMGTGTIDGRKVVVGGDDFTLRGGAADGVIGGKAGFAEQQALELRHPLVRLVDGSGGGGSVKTLEMIGASYVPYNPAMEIIVELMETVPVVGAALGSVAGLGAARVALSHFSVMPSETAQMFVAGPPLVEAATGLRPGREELGGSQIHTHNGAVDNEAESEVDAFRQIRRFLSFLPPSVHELPPLVESDEPLDREEEELLQIVPREKRKPHPVRRIIELVFDLDSFFEIGPGWGRSLVTGFARLAGHPVGVMANDPMYLGGTMDADASRKMARHVDLCDTFHLPIVNLVDNPGFTIGIDGEQQGTIRHGATMLCAVYQSEVPWCSIILRRVFGVAGAAHRPHHRFTTRYAWPSGRWGSLPLEGGIEAAYKRHLAEAENPEAARAEIERQLAALEDPFRTAEIFGIEEIIDPRHTRPLLCEWVENAYRILPTQLGPKRRGMRP
jgi:acetyl-CoA carboxylase carboxyltransferase component